MKKDYLQVRQEIIKNNPSGGMGGRTPCPQCGIEIQWMIYMGVDQCPVCNPKKHEK